MDLIDQINMKKKFATKMLTIIRRNIIDGDLEIFTLKFMEISRKVWP